MKKTFVVILIVVASTAAYAGKVYTPNQLNRMVNSGQYPDQGPVSTQTKSMSFAVCKLTAETVMSQISRSYPVKVILDTSALYTVKAWVNDGAITVSCSNPDSKMVITRAQYR
jgi:hypothetical protein